jgi:hypothetical protein
MCMEAILRISLYSYFYLKLAKTLIFLFISYVFSPTQLENKRAEQVLPQSRGLVQIMHIHVSKCKNDKNKNKKKELRILYVRAGGVAQWYSDFLECTRHWV